jgi:hypothetical protein
VWIDVEDGVGVFAVVHAAGGEDDGDEVDAGVFEERAELDFVRSCGGICQRWIGFR